MPGFDVRLGDALNGFLAHGKVKTWAEVEAWLSDQCCLSGYPITRIGPRPARPPNRLPPTRIR
jgi:hypothetical protein